MVLETAHDLTAMRDLDLVLQAIVRRARQIFSCDIGYLTNFDRLHNDFYIRATDGAISERFKNVRVPLDHGICGYIFEHKIPYHSGSYLTDRGFTHDGGIDRAVQDEGVRSLLGAPLMVGTHCIGVLCICDRHSRNYAPWEISLLATLAAQAATAIENARLFQETQSALQRAGEANTLLHRQAEEIEVAAEAHERMTRLVSRGCTVTDILNIASTILDGHVALLDEAEELTHNSTAEPPTSINDLTDVLGQIAGQDTVHRALTESRVSGKSQLADFRQDLEVRVAALVGAERLLGSMIVITRHDLTPMQVRTFERAALVAGVVLLSQEGSELAASNEAATIIRALIHRQQESAEDLRARTKPLGLDLAAPFSMIVLSVEALHIEYALRRVRTSNIRGVLVEEYDGLIVALAHQSVFPALHAALETKLIRDSRLGTIGVISNVLPRVDMLPHSFRALRRGIDILRALGRKCELVNEGALSMYALLFEQHQAADVATFIEATIGSLLSHDRRRNGDLTGTVLAISSTRTMPGRRPIR